MARQDDYIKTALRLPPELHAAIHEAAKASGKSYNAEIIARLQASVDGGPTSGEFALATARHAVDVTRLEFERNRLAKERGIMAAAYLQHTGDLLGASAPPTHMVEYGEMAKSFLEDGASALKKERKLDEARRAAELMLHLEAMKAGFVDPGRELTAVESTATPSGESAGTEVKAANPTRAKQPDNSTPKLKRMTMRRKLKE